jgi:hypothetical protein
VENAQQTTLPWGLGTILFSEKRDSCGELVGKNAAEQRQQLIRHELKKILKSAACFCGRCLKQVQIMLMG